MRVIVGDILSQSESGLEKTGQEKQTYEIQVGGFPLKLKSSHDSQTVDQLASLVNEKVEAALAAHPSLAYQKALLLACLHMAEDLVLLKRTAMRELDQLELQAKQVFVDLESSPLSRIRLDN